MSAYSEVVTAWEKLWNSYYYEDMPFFRVIMHYFYKNTNKGYITPEEMKSLILHYKNALNEYKIKLLEIDYKNDLYERRFYILRKKIQSEYERLLKIYDDLLNVGDMTYGKFNSTTRTTTKIK